MYHVRNEQHQIDVSENSYQIFYDIDARIYTDANARFVNNYL